MMLKQLYCPSKDVTVAREQEKEDEEKEEINFSASSLSIMNIAATGIADWAKLSKHYKELVRNLSIDEMPNSDILALWAPDEAEQTRHRYSPSEAKGQDFEEDAERTKREFALKKVVLERWTKKSVRAILGVHSNELDCMIA